MINAFLIFLWDSWPAHPLLTSFLAQMLFWLPQIMYQCPWTQRGLLRRRILMQLWQKKQRIKNRILILHQGIRQCHIHLGMIRATWRTHTHPRRKVKSLFLYGYNHGLCDEFTNICRMWYCCFLSVWSLVISIFN